MSCPIPRVSPSHMYIKAKLKDTHIFIRMYVCMLIHVTSISKGDIMNVGEEDMGGTGGRKGSRSYEEAVLMYKVLKNY